MCRDCAFGPRREHTFFCCMGVKRFGFKVRRTGCVTVYMSKRLCVTHEAPSEVLQLAGRHSNQSTRGECTENLNGTHGKTLITRRYGLDHHQIPNKTPTTV